MTNRQTKPIALPIVHAHGVKALTASGQCILCTFTLCTCYTIFVVNLLQKGETAFDIAKRKGNSEIMSLVERADHTSK